MFSNRNQTATSEVKILVNTLRPSLAGFKTDLAFVVYLPIYLSIYPDPFLRLILLPVIKLVCHELFLRVSSTKFVPVTFI